MARAVGRETIKRQTIRDLKTLKLYKKEYDRIIDIYADLLSQYNNLSAEFKDSGYQYEVNTDQGGNKKAPIIATLETLRKDILAYSDRLCLNPKAGDGQKPDKPGGQSKLAALLSGMP